MSKIEAIMTMWFTFGTVELTEPWSLIDPDIFIYSKRTLELIINAKSTLKSWILIT